MYVYIYIYMHVYACAILRMYICMYVCMCVCLWLYKYLRVNVCVSCNISICPSIYLSIYLSTYQSIYLSTYQSIYLRIYIFIFLSIYLFIYLCIYVSVYIYISTYPFIFLPINPYIYIYIISWTIITRTLNLIHLLKTCLPFHDFEWWNRVKSSGRMNLNAHCWASCFSFEFEWFIWIFFCTKNDFKRGENDFVSLFIKLFDFSLTLDNSWMNTNFQTLNRMF